MGEGLGGGTDFVVEGLRFDEDGASLFEEDGVVFGGGLPGVVFDFGVVV